MNYAELKEMAIKKELVVLSGYCTDNRHGKPKPLVKQPVYHKAHIQYGECVIVDEDLAVILKPGETLYDLNAAIGCCCIHTLEKLPKDYLKEVIEVQKKQGVSLEDFLEIIRKSW